MNKIYLDKDYKKFKITQKTKKDIINSPKEYMNCDVRIRMGLFYTDEEKEEYIKKSLSKPLPGNNPSNEKIKIKSKI